MHDLKVNRRSFLQASTGLLLGTLLFSSGPIALLAPSQTWALEMNNLDSAAGAKLLLIVRRIYPHDQMEDAVYAFAVKALDGRAASDPGTASLLRQGLAELDRAAHGNWSALNEQQQVTALIAIKDSPFFALVRTVSVNSLYSNELAYKHFGYEGASFPKGGYLMRGFDDLKWLPAPTAEASPNPFS
jgi:hypothetical protein